ncbi:MAG: 2-phospho-L-lactate transferase [Candidatus Lokiarchaeota archaeon]
MKSENYLLLAGGVGAAKFIDGLQNIVEQRNLKIIVNTGDDIELFGLTICPDLDIITYTLAGLVDKEKGWGFNNETFNCLNVLKKYYDFDWFNAGDMDLATHIYRTDLLNKGFVKSDVTKMICEKLGVKSLVIPMSNEKIQTLIQTPNKLMHFEEYFIKYECKPKIHNIEFEGIEKGKPIPETLKLIENASKIIICPSNPIVSIGPILKVREIRESLKKVKEKVIAISPIIKGKAIKGPADKMLKNQGFEKSSYGVAKFYQDIIGTFILDNRDSELKPKIEGLGINCYCFDTLMTDMKKKKELANFTINL